MSDFKKNDNDSMSGYAENISKKDRYFEISYEDENGSGQGYIFHRESVREYEC